MASSSGLVANRRSGLLVTGWVNAKRIGIAVEEVMDGDSEAMGEIGDSFEP